MAATYNKTAYANLKTGDVVIITEQKNDDVYAASNDQGTAKPPVATAVTVADDAITTDATNILWTVEKDGDNISFLAGETYLYCTNTNNGVRVGTNANKVFSIDATSGYLYNNATSRYIGVYNGADWRCYTSVNSNITGQTLGFYVLAQEQGGEGGDDPQPATRTIYLNGGGASLWNQADAVFFVHAWGGAEADVLMTQVEGDVYSATIPSDNTSLLFVRMAPGSEAINWDTKWNQSADQTIPADKDLFTMTDWSNGTWSVYGETPEPPAPVEVAYYLVGTMNNWTAAEAYKFAAAETEGEYLLHTTLAVGDELKVIKVEGEATTWYPAEGGNYVVDAAHAGEKDIYFRPAGNEAWADFGGYIWMGENQPAPVADFTQPFTLKFNGTGESGKDASAAFTADVAAIFDAASAPYVASVETATKIYAGRPISEDNSSVKFGTTSAQGSFAFTLAQGVEVDSIIVNATQYGNNAAKVTVNGTEFDLTAGNKVPQDCKITPEGAVSVITIAQSGTERIYLRNVRVYPKAQGGETPEQPEEIVLPVVKLAGSLTSWEEPVLMANAEDSLSATLTLNLGIDHYQLKVVSDGNWLTRAGEGDLFTMHRDYPHVDHLNLINSGDNIKLITDVAGEYTFTWTYADSSLVVTFPEAPAQPKFYITGNEDIVGEGNPTWGKNGALESFSDTLVMNLAAGQHKFKLITPAEQWLGMEALTDTAYGLFTDDDTNICFALAEAGAVTVIYNATEFKVEGNFYIAPVAKYYLIGDSAFVVDAGATADKAWTPDAIPSFQDTTVLNLKAGVDYIMRLSLNGTWENHRDFRHLTDTAAGLIELPDEYQNRSIGFSLNEAGPVTVIYIPATEEQPEVFKLIGDFYVAPVEEPAKYYITGDSALVVDAGLEAAKAWAPAAIKAENDTMVLNLNADQAYKLKITLNGEWETGRGYSSLSEKPEGITTDGDDNIIFTLAEAGAVNVIYVATKDTIIYKVEGNFYVAPVPDPTVAVMGSMNDWAEEIPFVLSDDKTYASLTVNNIGADEYAFKFIINGEWRSNGYRYHRGFPGAAGITENNEQNMVFEADVDGEYTFYWYFANDSAAIVYPELPFACDWDNIEFLGDGSPEQTHGNQFKLCKEGEYPGVVNVQKPGFADESGIYVTFPSAAFGEISLPESAYAIQGAGMILYCSAFTEEFTEVTVVCDNNPIIFTVYNAAAAVVPDPTVAVMGSMNDWAEEIPFVLSDDKTYASLTVNNIGADEYAFKFIINGEWRSNGYRYHRGFPGAAGITENNEANMVFVADQDGEYTFTWFFANDSLAITYPEYIEPVYNLENGYYLVGTMNEWTPAAENLFELNSENEAEYQLAINLAENDEVKVVYVENDAIVTWYPNEGENYVVDHNHAGATTMYFRPDYLGGEGWHAGCIYVVPTDQVGVDNVDANAAAVKVLREGQILIIRGNKTFNAQGQQVK